MAGSAILRAAVLACATAGIVTAAVEVLVPLPQGGHVALTTRGPSAFRMRLFYDEAAGRRQPLASPIVAPDEADAPFEEVQGGITSAFGSAVVTSLGELVLQNSRGIVLTKSHPLGRGACDGLPNTRPVGGMNVSVARRVASESACCAACGITAACTDWAFKLEVGTGSGHCWLGKDVSSWEVSSGHVSGRRHSVVSLSTRREAKLYGRGAGPEDAMRLTATSATASIVNRATYVPYYYSTDGYAALGVVDTPEHNVLPIMYSTDGERLAWGHKGPFELYFMPAVTLDTATQAYFSLTGAPRVLPLYAFGFMASRWGWESKEYVEETLFKFRKGKYPIDAFICDFEWFANQSDYDFPPEGKAWYSDFGYNPETFPEPRRQLSDYTSALHFRMGGIRKPRLGNSALLKVARSKGWMAPAGGPETYAEGRWVSFSEPAMRAWYGRQQAHYLENGVQFWWNDEGENQYFTYHWWNTAQVENLRRSKRASQRFFSLNRAFSPGLARLGAAVWTGDINASWEDLQRTPGMMLNWALAGAPYVACDIGGFSGGTTAELLTRWYQAGIFLPLMRVHSTLADTPHWPWNFGDEHAAAMRAALELRYRLLPYHYSLAHAMFANRSLWMRPLVMDFPGDAEAAEITLQWMDGQILVAPILQEDSHRSIYLPAGLWYSLHTHLDADAVPHTLRGPSRISGHADLQEVPAFVRAGAVVPLAPLVQHTDELPGGPLEVQVYGGADGSFELVEDDGESVAYEEGRKRITKLVWHDVERTLCWSVHGTSSGPRAFSELFVTLVDERGLRLSEVVELAASHCVNFPDRRPALL